MNCLFFVCFLTLLVSRVIHQYKHFTLWNMGTSIGFFKELLGSAAGHSSISIQLCYFYLEEDAIFPTLMLLQNLFAYISLWKWYSGTDISDCTLDLLVVLMYRSLAFPFTSFLLMPGRRHFSLLDFLEDGVDFNSWPLFMLQLKHW